jgi:phage FluMu gp28-like protein
MPSVQSDTVNERPSGARGRIEYRIQRAALYPKQAAAINDPVRMSVVEASTKSGKTEGSIDWLIAQTMKVGEGKHTWWVAPVSQQADIAFRRMRSRLWSTAAGRKLYRSYLQKKAIQFPTGSMVWFKSGDRPDSLYGEDVHAVVVDEASRVKEEAWHAVRTTLTATRGTSRIIGNVKGRKNWFYKLARAAQNGAPNAHWHKITWRDAVEAGVLDEDEIDAARNELPENVFKELYEAEASDDQSNPFGYDKIENCIGPIDHEAKPYVWGWDLAKKRDYTVGIALAKTGQVCRFLRFQKPWEETFNTILTETLRTTAIVDATGVGDPLVERLQRATGGQAYNGFEDSNYTGYVYTARSKQQLMENLAVAIGRRELIYPKGPIVEELKMFEYEYTRTGVRYTAPEGFFDDCVNALALAAIGREKARFQFDTSLDWV